MLEVLTGVSLLLFGGILLLLLIWAQRFTSLFPPRRESTPSNRRMPRATVLLSIRGADPSLKHCLDGLLRQDYPKYAVRIIIDSPEDPAWEIVREMLEAHPDADVQVAHLEDRRQTCSLKLSALVQALGELDESCEVVALIDADVIPHRTWLRDLVAPLADPAVGATSGIRWYAPRHANPGTLVRHLWNATASVVMHAVHIPWGGSLAFRSDVIRDSDLKGRWSRSLFEDTDIYHAVGDLGLRIRFVSAATMINPESTDLPGCFRFIRRQLLNARLYHSSWPVIVAHGAAISAAPLLALGILAAACMKGAWAMMLALTGGLALYGLGLGYLLLRAERHIRDLARERGEEVAPMPWQTWAAIPLTQAVYLAALLSASFMRRVDWRGITYELQGPRDVRLVEYRPYLVAARGPDRSASLI
jgi:cellulose synthase/poly-beta-1,6-N-acetylglucosamine synthase-like glycosyltransferase